MTKKEPKTNTRIKNQLTATKLVQTFVDDVTDLFSRVIVLERERVSEMFRAKQCRHKTVRNEKVFTMPAFCAAYATPLSTKELTPEP
jgi:hypothetical protein